MTQANNDAIKTHMATGPVVILAAMDVEADVLIKALGEDVVTESFGVYRFYQGVFAGLPVIVVRCYIGSANAAAATAIAIERYHPYLVICQGTAGGHNELVHRGSIIVGTKVCNIAALRTGERAAGEGSDPDSWEFFGAQVRTDHGMDFVDSLEADQQLINLACSVACSGVQVHPGVIGSGDVWTREIDRIKMLNQRFDTCCEDMESFAVAQVCHQLSVKCLCIRVISNNSLLGEEYDRTLGRRCQQFVLELLRSVSSALRWR